jgi:dUTP pyrophosphatase
MEEININESMTGRITTSPMKIKFKKLVPEAKTPFRKIDVDAGFDIFALSKKETPDYIEYLTGIAFEIPEGYVGLVFPRSSVTSYDLMLKNCVGVIDASYRGEIRCRFARIPSTEFKDLILWTEDVMKEIKGRIEIKWSEEKQYEIGERIAQIVFLELPKITLEEVQELSETERGSQGFGHTGK